MAECAVANCDICNTSLTTCDQCAAPFLILNALGKTSCVQSCPAGYYSTGERTISEIDSYTTESAGTTTRSARYWERRGLRGQREVLTTTTELLNSTQSPTTPITSTTAGPTTDTTTAPPCPSSEYICLLYYNTEFPCQSGAVASGLSASETVLTANNGSSYCYLARTVPAGQTASVSCTYLAGTDVNTPVIIIADSNVTALEAFFSHGYNTAQAYDPFLTYLSTNHPSSGQFVGNGETSLTANQNVFFVAATGSRFDCTYSLDPTTTTAPPCPSSEYICPSYDAEFPCQSGAVASGLSASETVLTANIGFSYCYLARTVPVGQMASVSCTYVGTDVNTPVIIIADSDVTALEAFFPSGYDSAQAYGPFLTYLNTNHPSSGQFVGNGTTTLTANQNVFFVAATGSGFDCTYSLGPATTTTTASWQPLTRNSTITTLSTAAAATMGVTTTTVFTLIIVLWEIVLFAK